MTVPPDLTVKDSPGMAHASRAQQTDAPGNIQITSLVARLEAATGPDVLLDAAICDLVYERLPPSYHILNCHAVEIAYWRRPDGNVGMAAQFTSSLDAALKLIPDRIDFWDVARFKEEPYFKAHLGWKANEAEIEYWRPQLQEPINELHLGENGKSRANPALALCIAALKARLSLTPSDTQ